MFCSEYRPKVKAENPSLTISEMAKKLGEKWNSTSAEDKVPFEKKASKLKEKYDKVDDGVSFSKRYAVDLSLQWR